MPATTTDFPREGCLRGDRLFFATLDRAFWAFGRASIAAARTVLRMELRHKIAQRQFMEEIQHGSSEVATGE